MAPASDHKTARVSSQNQDVQRAADVQAMLHTKVPGCRLISILGTGGMGTVFLARQENLGRLVAVKMLNRDLVNQSEFAEGLLREARIMGGFSHPNLVNCHDVIQNKDGIFIIMEYIPGHLSGREIVDRLGPIPELFVIQSLISVCHALEYICGQGFLHLDMKPDNLLFYRDIATPPNNMSDVFERSSSRVAVCDFGIAMQLKDRNGMKINPDASVMGSPFYMSPEQLVSPEKVDFRSDMYALAATAWFFISGKDPYGGMSEADMLRCKVNEDFGQKNRFDQQNGISQQFQRILRKMSKVKMEDRYGSYGELINELEILEIEQKRYHKKRVILNFISLHFDYVCYCFVLLMSISLAGLGIYNRYLQGVEERMASEWASLDHWGGSFEGWNRTLEYGGRLAALRGYDEAAPLWLQNELSEGQYLSFQMKCYDEGEVTFSILSYDDVDEGGERRPVAQIVCKSSLWDYTVSMEQYAYDSDMVPYAEIIPTPTDSLDLIRPDNMKDNELSGWTALRLEHYPSQLRVWSGSRLLGVVHLPDDLDCNRLMFRISSVSCRMLDLRNVKIEKL